MSKPPLSPITAREAFARLRAGNARFVQGVRSVDAMFSSQLRHLKTGGQEPMAIILGCSDSRVPAETIFDQGLGDLFVIRVAGNIVAPSQIGSVEFAAERFHTPLVVVLGHSMCGAIEATIEALEQPDQTPSANLKSIVDFVRPAVVTLFEADTQHDHATLVHHAVRANIRASVAHLTHGSEILERFVREKRLVIVGADYSLETGVVDFFEGDAEFLGL